MINEMLELASKQDIKPWVTKRPLEDANQAVVDMHNVSSLFRFVFERPLTLSSFPRAVEGSL